MPARRLLKRWFVTNRGPPHRLWHPPAAPEPPAISPTSQIFEKAMPTEDRTTHRAGDPTGRARVRIAAHHTARSRREAAARWWHAYRNAREWGRTVRWSARYARERVEMQRDTDR